MTIRITRPIQGGATNAIESKSQAHRLLICAALSSRETRVICSETNDDIDATARCLNALVSLVIYESVVFCFSPIKRPVQGKKNLDVGESGSTLRFMLPVACALGADAVFIRRQAACAPLTPLYEELNAHGCALSPKDESAACERSAEKTAGMRCPAIFSSSIRSAACCLPARFLTVTVL